MAKNINTKVELLDKEQSTPPKYKYEFPYWANKENRHIIVTIVYPDGRKSTASIQDPEGTNPDAARVLEEFGEKVLDENTAEGIKRRDDNIKKRLERRETEAARAKQEVLFASKLDSFEIPYVKDSKNTHLKRLIRKANTPMEVQAYTTILIAEELKQVGLLNVKEEK